MPTAQMIYKLPEENEEFKMANNGIKYFGILWELKNELRSRMKHDSDALEKITGYQAFENIWTYLHDIAEGVDI